MSYDTRNNIGEVEIMALLHKNNEKALTMIFNIHHRALLSFSMKYVQNCQTAEDIVAESFFIIWEKRNDFQSLTAIRSFLYKAVKHACINHCKQVRRHTASHENILISLDLVSSGDEGPAIDQIIRAELLQKLWEDAEKLPPVRRKIFKMFFKEELTVFEIAQKLQISTDTVRVQKARALNRLRVFVKQKLF